VTSRAAAQRPPLYAGNRCPRCHQNDPPAGHEDDCATWHLQMANTDRAARQATKLSPTYPVTPAQAIDLLAHLTSRDIPAAGQVVQLVLDLGWRPFTGALAAPLDPSLPDPGGTADLLADLPP
jgi:hypothetical protein